MRIRPLTDHIICAVVDRDTLDRLMTAEAPTARDVSAASRIVRVGEDTICYGLVLAVGLGRVHPSTGRLHEPQTKQGDIVLFPANAARLDLSYVAKELVAPLWLAPFMHNAKTFSICEDSCEAVVEPS
jgi:co-chaperonin GroES (HSP10)